MVPKDPKLTSNLADLGILATDTVSKIAKKKKGHHMIKRTPISAKTPGTYLLELGHSSPLGVGYSISALLPH